MGIESEWKNRGIRVGKLPCGPLDKISDVPGVTVGHCTLSDGEVQTGVTALLPHPGDIFHDKVMAASRWSSWCGGMPMPSGSARCPLRRGKWGA